MSTMASAPAAAALHLHGVVAVATMRASLRGLRQAEVRDDMLAAILVQLHGAPMRARTSR